MRTELNIMQNIHPAKGGYIYSLTTFFINIFYLSRQICHLYIRFKPYEDRIFISQQLQS